MHDTDRSSSLPSTIPPPPPTPAESAAEKAFLRLEEKVDRLTDHIQRLSLLAEDVFSAVQEDRVERGKMRDEIEALKRIPHTTILPPPNSNLDG